MTLGKPEHFLLVIMTFALIIVPVSGEDQGSNVTLNETTTELAVVPANQTDGSDNTSAVPSTVDGVVAGDAPASMKRNATAAAVMQPVGSPFIFNGNFAGSPANAMTAQVYDHYVSFSMRANSLAPNYAYDLVNRGDRSDGSRWVYNMYMFGTDSSGYNGRIQVQGYNHISRTWNVFSPLSAPLSPGVNYTIVWRYSRTTGGELLINGVSQGVVSPGTSPDTSLSSTFYVGENMYTGGGRQHSAFYGTITDVYDFERDLTPPPVANFTATPTSGTAPLTVQFTDQSTNTPTSWSWNFGDGGTSTAQNPSHEYTSAGTYTVNLTATNVAGSDGETKTGYVTVTAPVSNQATDVAGRSITQSDAALAASQQQLMNYQVTTLYPAKQSDIIPRLPNDQIFFFDGHGTEGAIQLNDTLALPDQTLFYGTNDVNSFDEVSTSYSNMNLAVLLACKAGGTSSEHGNIVDVIASKGASCAIGWTENILDEGGPTQWSATFWNRIHDGDPILDAYDKGVAAAQSHPYCQNVYQTWPDIWDTACNLTKKHYAENNDGCSQHLPSALASRMVSASNVKTTTEKKSLKTSLSSARKKLIVNSVSTFVKKSVNNVEYKEAIHYPYADLYQVKAGDSSYWVNANNGRVQSMTVSKIGSKTTTRIIDLDQGSKIAESYAKEKYPELWNVSEGKGIKQIVKKINELGSDQTFEYSWQEIFHNPRLYSSKNAGIPGSNLVTITVNPYTGKVIQYHEWYVPYDSNLNLTPSLTKDESRRYAESYFHRAGSEKINPDEISSPRLSIAIDENNHQHLTWSFELTREDAHNLEKSGFVGIDAHNGEIVWHASIT